MARKRKSVTFHESVSLIYPKPFDGSSSPSSITNTPESTAQLLTLDPMYLTWLRSATKAHYPFIVNGTFATYVYRQNFDEHIRIKDNDQFEKAKKREAAVPLLADKYGSLGWGNLYREVDESAWVKNYREVHRFEGSDELLLEKIAEAYDEIKRSIAQEENARAHVAHDGSGHMPPRSAQQWESFTQAGGALMSPDFGPGGVKVTFDDAIYAPFEEEGHVLPSIPQNHGGFGQTMVFDMGLASQDCGGAMLNDGVGV